MKSNAFSAILIIVGMLLLGLVISLQMTILSDWELPFGLDFGSPDAASTASQAGAALPSTAAPVTPVAVATDTPVIVVVQPTPTLPVAADAVEPTATTAQAAPTLPAVANAQPAAGAAVAAALPAAGQRLLTANRMTTSSDDQVLVDVVASNPFAIGFVSHAAYMDNQELVRSVPLPAADGNVVQPDANTVTDDIYPLTYPLYLYTSAQTLRSQPEVASFVGCYLSRSFSEAEAVGLFPPSIPDFAVTVATFSQQAGMEPTCNAMGLSPSTISVMTANSLVPLTQRIAGAFRTAGYAGVVEMQTREAGRSAQLFCEEGLGDIIAVSRALNQDELATCQAAGREMVSFEVAKDALTVVVSQENSFLTQASLSELQLLFAEGSVWSNVNQGWPNEAIARAVPSDQSGGFAEFVTTVFDSSVPQMAINLNTAAVAAAPAENTSAAPTTGNTTDAAPAAPATGENPAAPAAEGTVDFVVAGVQGREECTVLASVVAQVLETNYGKTVTQVVANNPDELFNRLAWDVSDAGQQIDISTCYTDLGDRVYLREKGSKIALMNNTYGLNGEDKLYMIAYSSIPPMLRSEEACIYEFFRNISLEDVASMRGQDPTTWLAQNADMVAEWTSCSVSE